MSEIVVEYGFRLPERERSRVVIVSEEDARAFVAVHPQCDVVQRTVRVGDWVVA